MDDHSISNTFIKEEEIENLKFLKPSSGAYCFKTDDEGKTIRQSYIYSDYNKLIVFDNLSLTDYCVFDRDSPDINFKNRSCVAIAEFIDELTSRIILKNSGTYYEKEIAKTYWQMYIYNQNVPIKLQSRVNEILDSIK